MVEIRDLESHERYGEAKCPECGHEYMRFGLEDDEESRYQPFVGCDSFKFEVQTDGFIRPTEVSSKEEVWEEARKMCLGKIN